MRGLFDEDAVPQKRHLPYCGLINNSSGVITRPDGSKVIPYARILVRRILWILNLWPTRGDIRYEVLKDDAVSGGGFVALTDIPKLFEQYPFLWIVRYHSGTLPETLLDILNTIEKPYQIIVEHYANDDLIIGATD